jgi:parallel beta-helix repeat protein
VSVSGARIAGKVVSNVDGPADYWLQYGTTAALGSETPHQTATLDAYTPLSVIVEVTGLARDTVYHYRLCADDAEAGPVCGGQRSFRTQEVACGETVTQDVRLTGDLDCGFGGLGPGVGGNGLVIGAAGLDVNLAGHRLDGPVESGGGEASGIDNSGGFDDLIVRNGSLGLWGDAIHLEGASGNLMHDLGLQGSPFGISIAGGSSNDVRNSEVSGRVTGIVADQQVGLVVARTTVTAGSVGGDGMVIDGSGNRIADNDVQVGFAASSIEVTGSGNRIVNNRATGGSGFGSAVGITLLSGSDNVVAENEVSDAVVVIPGDTEGSVGDGIFIGPLATGTLVRDNYAHDNEGDGIEVQSAGTRLKDNRADNNGDFGIQAVAGVIDLGGNSASGNGNPLQCVNVFCQ